MEQPAVIRVVQCVLRVIAIRHRFHMHRHVNAVLRTRVSLLADETLHTCVHQHFIIVSIVLRVDTESIHILFASIPRF